MKYLNITPATPDKMGECVQPEMEKPIKRHGVRKGTVFNKRMDKWDAHINSLPKLPTTCTLPAGEWFEGAIRYERSIMRMPVYDERWWTLCTKAEYEERSPALSYREVIVPVEQFDKKEMQRVQDDIDSVMAGKVIDRQKLHGFPVSVAELSDVLHNVQQVLGGYSQDDTWSEYDESVKKSVLELQRKIEPYHVPVEQKDEPKRDGMEEVTIYRFQLDAILEALRVAANSYDLRKQETCLGRMVTQAERFVKNALNGKKDKYVRYGQSFPQPDEKVEPQPKEG